MDTTEEARDTVQLLIDGRGEGLDYTVTVDRLSDDPAMAVIRIERVGYDTGGAVIPCDALLVTPDALKVLMINQCVELVHHRSEYVSPLKP